MNTDLKNQLEKFYDEKVWDHITLGEFITDCAAKYGDATAVVSGDIKLSYKDIDRKSNSFANGLLKAGFKPGDKIVLQLPNCHTFIIIAFAMFKIGVVPIMSLPAQRKHELKGIIEKAGAAAYMAKDKYLGFSYVDMIRDIKAELNRSFDVYILGDEQEFKNFSELNENNYTHQKTRVDYKDMGLLLLSGGTTGVPKLIPRRHCDYLYVAKKTALRSGMDKGSIYRW